VTVVVPVTVALLAGFVNVTVGLLGVGVGVVGEFVPPEPPLLTT